MARRAGELISLTWGPHRSFARWAVLILGLGLALCSRPVRAEELQLLESDQDAARARVSLIRGARSEIFAAYFIVADDATGMAGLHLLRAAARRGVDVRLIVDAQWNGVNAPLLSHLVEEGVQVKLYHAFSVCKLSWVTRRMHDKLLIVDGDTMITGGRNIENAYFGFGDRSYVDRDVQVRGFPSGEARDYFLELWESRHVSLPRRGWLSGEWLTEAADRLDEAADILKTSPLLQGEGLESAKHDVSAERLRFFNDEVGHVRKRPGIRADLLEVLMQTRQSVIIESPYLVVNRKLTSVLRELIGRGVRVRILTNSLNATDNVWPQAGYVGKKDKLVKMGVELWEYVGPRTLHSKTAVLDGRVLIVGSYNLDPRSATKNTEVAIVVEDEAAAAEARRTMDANLANAWQIGRDGRPLGEARRYPGVPPIRRLKVRLIRLALPFIRDQL